ncbi:hypothetical protein SISSUDRAFT_1050083 [Sistotremastrum suecicum HHB10207 ss-3]|uniref:F-box domain-containing protein n=1 Tax=Sistotremastrum suecicum HHB10207 ss-3 TaxID=1314776 RepID=A0A166BEX3_9AGAM|nr:hypothetical protein SISSUDRAFT_1050083 [Sistotremastrum suecicum HHB10207 ss-3]
MRSSATDASSDNIIPPLLPFELYRDVVENVTEVALLRLLSYVSPSFQKECERILWRYVSLKPPVAPWSTGTCQSLFARTKILSGEKAQFVRSLDLAGSPTSVPISKVAFQYFRPALQQMNRITTLRIRSLDMASPDGEPLIFPSLRHLSCQTSFSVDLLRFMKANPTIRSLYLECASTNVSIDEYYSSAEPEIQSEIDSILSTPLFPTLDTLSICSTYVPSLLWNLGPVQHLTIKFDEFARRSPEMLFNYYLNCRKRDIPSLKTLRIYGLSDAYYNRILDTMYLSFPNLEDLGGVTTSSATIDHLITMLSAFPRLWRLEALYDSPIAASPEFMDLLNRFGGLSSVLKDITLWSLDGSAASFVKWNGKRDATKEGGWDIQRSEACSREEISSAALPKDWTG